MINGLILAGGKSARMGFDKNRIDYHGKPQREYLFEMLTPFCDKVFVSCKHEADVPAALNPLADQFDLESPLNGILTAMTRHPSVAWLTVPADMPLVNAAVLAHLVRHRDASTFATCYWDSDHLNPEPLLALWEPQSFSALRTFYDKGHVSPREFLNESSITLLEVPLQDVHLNINTPEELNSFQQKHPKNAS